MALRPDAQKFIGLICAAYFSGCIALSGSQAQNAPTAAQSQAPATPQAAGTSPSAATPQATATPQAGTHAAQLGAESRWPLTMQAGDTKLTLYQPQLDSWDGYHLIARIATRAERGQEQEQKQTLFGVLNVSAETVTDKGEQTVLIRQAQVAKADFPSASPGAGHGLERGDQQGFCDQVPLDLTRAAGSGPRGRAGRPSRGAEAAAQ